MLKLNSIILPKKMKPILIILTLFLFSSLLSQENTPKRGSLKVRKKATAEVETISNKNANVIDFQPLIVPVTPPPIVIPKACNKYGWLNGNWSLIGFPDRTKEREAIFDEMYLINCTEVRINYSDLPTQKMSFTINKKENKITFKSETRTFDFDYTLKVGLGEKWDAATNNIIKDTAYKRLRLYNKEKEISFYLVTGRYTDEHNYFPHVCKEADEKINKWISEQTDSNGYKTRIKFNSCSQVNVKYENTLLKNRIEAIAFKYEDKKNYITLKKQKIGVPNEYFDSQYQIEFKIVKEEDKLVLTNKKESLTFSIEK